MGWHMSEWMLLRRWLPTVFGASMLVAEIPLVAAAVARSADGSQALAAIGIGMSILVVINTPALALAPLVASEQHRRGTSVLWRYSLAVGVVGSALLAGVALPPGSHAVAALFGLHPHLAGAVSTFLLGLAPNSFAVAVRRYLHGRLIAAGRTSPIIPATLIRIAATGAIAWTGMDLWPSAGPFVAGCALSIGAFLEGAGLALPVRRLPAGTPSGSVAGLVARHGHLSAARLLTMAPPLITTVGIAHAANAPASLIVWPVITELVSLFSSPTTDWEAVTAVAARHQQERAASRRLTGWLAAALTALIIATLVSGLADVFVRDLVAVAKEPADLGLHWAFLLVPVPALWVLRGYLRGRAIGQDAAGRLTVASIVHTVVLVAVVAALSSSGLPGVACGGIAVVAGLAADVAITGWPTGSVEVTARPSTG
jgi:hypothetical protein